MTIRTLMLAIVIAALSFPLAAKAQDGIGPTNWANAGGSDPARDLVGLGVRVFDRGYFLKLGEPVYTFSPYSAQALDGPKVSGRRKASAN